ncbi:hypothetical protein ACWEXP_13680 [Staphylococcus pseudoxylosus]
MNFNDINISIDNVNLTPDNGILKHESENEVDFDKVLYELDNLDQSKRSKYIRVVTLNLLDLVAAKEGRDFNRTLDSVILDYIKNHHKNDYVNYVEEIYELSKKESEQET